MNDIWKIINKFITALEAVYWVTSFCEKTPDIDIL